MVDWSQLGPEMHDRMNHLAASAEGSELAFRLLRSIQTTSDLRKLVPLLLEVADTSDRRSPSEVAFDSPAGRKIDQGRGQAICDQVEAINSQIETALSALPFNKKAADEITDEAALTDPFGSLAAIMPTAAVLPQLLESLATLTVNSLDEAFFLNDRLGAENRPLMVPFIAGALYMRAMSLIEPSLRRLLKLALRSADRARFSDLGSIELDEAVQKIMQGGPAAWRSSLLELPSGRALIEAVDWTALNSCWATRNILVHNDGFVDRKYVRLTRYDAPIGSPIEIRHEQCVEAIEIAGATRVAFVTAVLDSTDPGSGARVASALSLFVWDELRHGSPVHAEQLSLVEIAFAGGGVEQAYGMVDRWLAIEAQRGADAIKADVLVWDVSDLPKTFNLARAILLRDDRFAVTLYHELLKSGDLDEFSVEESPIFDRWRIDGLLSV